MNNSLLGVKIAVLVANGFAEKDFVQMQKLLQPTGANIRIIGMNHGLVNSWSREGWGLNFATDQVLSQALAADFDMLLVPGGQRSVDELQLTAHTRRFIGGFVDTGKPVVFFDKALELLLFSERADGMNVSGPADLQGRAEELGAQWSADAIAVHGNVMSGACRLEEREVFCDAALRFLTESHASAPDDAPAVAA